MGRVAGPDRVRRWSFSQQMPPLGYGPQTSGRVPLLRPPIPTTGRSGATPTPATACATRRSTPPASAARAAAIVGNDPDDTSIVVGAPFLADWVAFVASRAGAADAGGVRFLALDNEPMLWNSTHRDVHPAAPTYDEVWTKGQAVAAAARAVDPAVAILGPDTWGWCDLWTSAADAPRRLHRRPRPPGARRHAVRRSGTWRRSAPTCSRPASGSSTTSTSTSIRRPRASPAPTTW